MMRDVFFTLLAIWVVFRLFESARSQQKKSENFNTGNSPDSDEKGRDSKSRNNKEGEYVDYEEID